ncbi:MAG TPA: CPBP family intramembrane glutamic endopeptidase [Candidatus Eisenbacteria bacterium]
MAIAAAIFTVALGGFGWFALSMGARGADLVVACAMFSIFFGPCLALSVDRYRASLRAWLAPAPAIRVGAASMISLAFYACYAASQKSSLISVGKVALYEWFTIAIVAGWGPAGRRLVDQPGRFALAILALWLPVELRLVRGLFLPAGANHGFDLTFFAALALGLILVLAVSPVPDIGYSFRLKIGDLARAGLGLAAFAAVAIPLGLSIGFIVWKPAGFGPLEWVGRALAIYFVTAIPEELIFRGMVQNLLEKRWPGRPGRTLLLASVIFGAAHLNNPPAPNWPYMLLASLAGLAYGWVWMRTRRITASALTHMAVDLIWGALLHK